MVQLFMWIVSIVQFIGPPAVIVYKLVGLGFVKAAVIFGIVYAVIAGCILLICFKKEKFKAWFIFEAIAIVLMLIMILGAKPLVNWVNNKLKSLFCTL